MIYRALSVQQPYASQIASGEKTIEYRSRRTKYRGELLIVSSARPGIDSLPSGQAIALVDLIDCQDNGQGYSWMLTNFRPIKPFPVKGALGIYRVECQIPLQF